MTYEFTAELVTPLMIAGAKGPLDSQNDDLRDEGLRPTSLRGQLRYWFRAMMGGIVGDHHQYQTLQRLEAGIFGLTESSSLVRLRTAPINAAAMQFDQYPVRMNDCSPPDPSRPQRVPRRRGIQVATSFDVRVAVARNDRGQDQVVLGTVWLLAALGGVGGRIRRGFGSLALQLKGTAVPLTFLSTDDSLAALATDYSGQLAAVGAAFQQYAGPQPADWAYSTGHFVLRNGYTRLWLLAPQGGLWPTWQEAMRALRDDVYRPLKRALQVRQLGSGGRPRQASPLWLQIKRTRAGGHFGVLLAFDTQNSVAPRGSFHYFAHPQNAAQRWTRLEAFMQGLNSVQTQEVVWP